MIDCPVFLSKILILQPTNPILTGLIADRLKEIREQHNDTKEFVLHETGLGISDYERKAKVPTIESIAKFCKLYNMSLEDFFAGIIYPKETK